MLLKHVVYTVKPYPKVQAQVWQLYAHIQSAINANQPPLQLVDFKVPFNTYFGVESYMNQLQLSFRADTDDELSRINDFLNKPLPKHDVFKFTKYEIDEKFVKNPKKFIKRKKI